MGAGEGQRVCSRVLCALVVALSIVIAFVASTAPFSRTALADGASGGGNPFARGPAPTPAGLQASAGPYAVTVTSVTDAATPGFGSAWISYPDTTADGTFGAIAISPGFTSDEAYIHWYGPFLASHGFVVITFNTNSPNDYPSARATQLLAALDYLVSPASPVGDRIDPSRMAVMGHSMGGGGALEATSRRRSLKASIPLTPWHETKSWSDVTTPTLVIGAQDDSIASTTFHSIPFYESIGGSVPKAYSELRGEGHMVPITYDRTIAVLSVSWMKRFVDDDARYDQFLCPASLDTVTYSQYRATCPYTSLSDPRLPDKPLDVEVTAGDQQASISWSARADPGGTAVVGYRVQQTTDTGGVLRWSEPTGTCAGVLTERNLATSCTATKLANATSVLFRVTAMNSAGPGVDSPPVEAVPAGVPGAPGTPTAAAGDGSVTVTWTPPTSDGGKVIIAYSVSGSPGGSCSSDGALSCVVTGLTNATSYSFVVTAANELGTGPASKASVAVTPKTVPGAPPAPNVLAGDRSLSVSWSVPVDNGGSPITGYTVTAAPGPGSCSTTTVRTCAISGLSNGVPQSVTVRAVTVIGPGQSSPPTIATPRTLPGTPGAIAVSPGDGRLEITWAAPADNGGADVIGYVVHYRASGGAWSTAAPTNSSTVVLEGLPNGVDHEIRVAATNAAGTGPFSGAVGGRPRTVPGAMDAPAVAGAESSITVEWSPPQDDGGAVVTGYSVEIRVSGASEWVTRSAVSSARRLVVEGLPGGLGHEVRIAAENVAGRGAWSPVSDVATPVSTPPTGPTVTVVVGDGRLKASWEAPDNVGGSALVGYLVDVVVGGDPEWLTVAEVQDPQVVLSGLRNGTTYRVRVAAINALGVGTYGPSSVAVVPRGRPGSPTSLAVSRTTAGVRLTWAASRPNGTPVSDYVIQQRVKGGRWTVVDDGPSSATRATVAGLRAGRSYQFRVAARNLVGLGAWSAASRAVEW